MATLSFPAELSYTKEHTWLKEENGKTYVGISDYAQDQLGEVAFVDLPSVGDSFEAMGEFGTVESVKSVNTLFLPIAGTILTINENLDSEPSLVNTGPYTEGWMVQIEIAPGADRSELMSAADYQALVGA